MIYAIHNETKEHRLVTWKDSDWSYDWRIVEADSDGWIEWSGGECPLPDGAPFEAMRRDGVILSPGCVNFWGRSQKDEKSDIIAYRPILEEPEAPEWDGGNPPVGVECECWHTGTHQGVVTVRYMGSEMCVLLNHDHGEEQCGPIDAYSFRPIRSEEDKAVDEMARLLADEFDAAANDCIDAARALFRAGYRKTGGE